MTIESDNTIEEVQEIVEKCVKCGLCKGLCPVFLALRDEVNSPRGKVMLLQKDIFDKMVYDCTLCKACEIKCPLNLKLCDGFRKARVILVEKNKTTKENKEMIKNVKEFGNPFGKEKGKDKKLYCC